MFRRFHEKLKEQEGGFTLIELLVVILIIAILAAIAIPVFLEQRKKGWAAQTESAVKNMATAEESFLTSNSAYTSTLTDLEAEGFTFSSADVDPDVVSANGSTDYCLHAVSLNDASIESWYDSDVGAPQESACT